MRDPTPIDDTEKARQIILYVLKKLNRPVSDKWLQTFLYFCDFDYYEKYEKHLMGLTYIKL